MKNSSRTPMPKLSSRGRYDPESARKQELLAVFSELRDALCDRRMDQSVLKYNQESCDSMSSVWMVPDAVPADRLSSIFNLSVRYWDMNMPIAAIHEVCFRS
jgi:hypothetical protein